MGLDFSHLAGLQYVYRVGILTVHFDAPRQANNALQKLGMAVPGQRLVRAKLDGGNPGLARPQEVGSVSQRSPSPLTGIAQRCLRQ